MADRIEETQLRKMLQIGLIVRDVEKAIMIYEETFSIGPWEIVEVSNQAEPFRL